MIFSTHPHQEQLIDTTTLKSFKEDPFPPQQEQELKMMPLDFSPQQELDLHVSGEMPSVVERDEVMADSATPADGCTSSPLNKSSSNKHSGTTQQGRFKSTALLVVHDDSVHNRVLDKGASPTPLGKSFVPSRVDILCSRGKKSWNHPGNAHLRELVRLNAQRYHDAGTRIARSVVVSELVDYIRSRGTGFVKQESDGNTLQPKVGLG